MSLIVSRTTDLVKQYKLLQFLVFHWLILRRVMSSVDPVSLTISTFNRQIMISARCQLSHSATVSSLDILTNAGQCFSLSSISGCRT